MGNSSFPVRDAQAGERAQLPFQSHKKSLALAERHSQVHGPRPIQICKTLDHIPATFGRRGLLAEGDSLPRPAHRSPSEGTSVAPFSTGGLYELHEI